MMTALRPGAEGLACNFTHQVNKIIEVLFPQFVSAIKTHARFHFCFLALVSIEVTALVLFFPFFAKATLLALMMALLFLTIFSYLILRLYFQAKKPEILRDLCERFLEGCRELIPSQEGAPEHHMALASACCKFATALQGKEYTLYRPSPLLRRLIPFVDRLSCWWHWYDVHKMKEILLLTSVQEHTKLVKGEPTNLELHAALANAYVMLSGLYVDPRKVEGYEEERWLPPQRFNEIMQEKFQKTAERAVEELKILSHYAPNDPWVHLQLAYSYNDLKMPSEAIQEYEILRRLRPDDKEVLYKLGVLYFQQGQNAQGLQVYEELKRTDYKKAEALIQHYSNFVCKF